ncbi:Conserved_hypothetical protein [Hexamita inflata]|uniref:Uncharacterized protein n=1 Tax=Hexamita inflata TaxID=28002 RepID=A0AA86RZA7_9EUKA|nr:Conserved hypothetical protein [Hexamita inflata]
MLQLVFSIQLQCFYPNTTALLDVQTRELVFSAWHAIDSSRDSKVCDDFSGQMFQFSVQVSSVEYKYSILEVFDRRIPISIRISCTQVDKCVDAFKAKSALYTIDFQETNHQVTQVVSNLRRLEFNRHECYKNTALLWGRQITLQNGLKTDLFKLTAVPQNCKYPTDPLPVLASGNPALKSAYLDMFTYPNFSLQAMQYRVNPTMFIQNAIYPCQMMPNQAEIDLCNEMTRTLEKETAGYMKLVYSVPGSIPDRNGNLGRMINYTSLIESNEVKNVLSSQIDCFSAQQISLFNQKALLQNTLNETKINCNKQMNELIGNFDQMIIRVELQENKDFRTGKVFKLDFQVKSQLMNSSFEWLECQDNYCKEVLKNSKTYQNYFVNAHYLFTKNEQIVKLVPMSATLKVSQYSIAASLSNTEVCTNITQKWSSTEVEIEDGMYQLTYYIAGEQIASVNTLFQGSQQKYCAYHNFSSTNITNYVSQTGVLTIGTQMYPMDAITDSSQSMNVKNIQYIVYGTVVLVFIFVVCNIIKPRF